MDQVTSMSVFVHVVNAGSFTGAAKRLGISPACVTSRIQSFEQQLGVRVLNRTTRKLSLTEEGVTFYQRCSRILAEIADIQCLASTLQSTPNGTLRVNIDIALARIVGSLMGAYAALYPEVSCELIMTDQMVDMVEQKFDLAIFVGPLQDSALITRGLGIGRGVLCAAPTYLTHHSLPRHPKDLAQHNCLDLVNGSAGNQWRFVGKDGEHVVSVAGNLRSNSIEGLRAGALAGQGICLLPTSCVADDIERGALVRLLPAYEVAATTIHAVYPAGRHLSAKARTFLDFLIERLRDGEPDDTGAIKGEEAMHGRKVETSRNPPCLSQSSSAERATSSRVRAIANRRANRHEPMRMAG